MLSLLKLCVMAVEYYMLRKTLLKKEEEEEVCNAMLPNTHDFYSK